MILFFVEFIPALFLYNFGISFFAHLRGASPRNYVLYELLYDHIAIVALFLRTFVQGVRIFLILLVYFMAYDLFFLNGWFYFYLPTQERFFETRAEGCGILSLLAD